MKKLLIVILFLFFIVCGCSITNSNSVKEVLSETEDLDPEQSDEEQQQIQYDEIYCKEALLPESALEIREGKDGNLYWNMTVDQFVDAYNASVDYFIKDSDDGSNTVGEGRNKIKKSDIFLEVNNDGKSIVKTMSDGSYFKVLTTNEGFISKIEFKVDFNNRAWVILTSSASEVIFRQNFDLSLALMDAQLSDESYDNDKYKNTFILVVFH